MIPVQATVRRIKEDRKEDFFFKGYPRRYFFPHQFYTIPKCGVDGYELAQDMWGIQDPNRLYQIVLYGLGNTVTKLPEALFFDQDIIWHQQHMGRVGQIATANLIVNDNCLYTLEHQSDLVQRIYLCKEHRTRVNSGFKYWHHMLLNSVLNFAVEQDLTTICTPTADLIVEKYVNPRVDRKLFDRIYDEDINKRFITSRKNGWWNIDVAAQRHKLIRPEIVKENLATGSRMICLVHDLELGLKRRKGVPEKKDAIQDLETMLAVEKEHDCRATYSVPGILLDTVRHSIEYHSHCLSFYSFNMQRNRTPACVHNYSRDGFARAKLLKIYCNAINKIRCHRSLPPIAYLSLEHLTTTKLNNLREKLTLAPLINQLDKCREIDYRLKGYRPCHSESNSGLNDMDLCYHNFEWIAEDNSTPSALPMLQNRLVKIPVAFHAHEIPQRGITYDYWESQVLASIEKNEFGAIGLCGSSASHWLPYYSRLLERLGALGSFVTLNDIANQVFLSHSI